MRCFLEGNMDFSIDTEIHFKIIKLCDDLSDEFSFFEKKFTYVPNIGRKNLSNFNKSFIWGICQDIYEILRCYPHSPNFFEPSIDYSLNSLCTIKTFLVYTNSQSPLLEETRRCWNESIDLIKEIGAIWDETKSGFDDFEYDPMKIYKEWSEKDNLKALYIYLYGKEHMPVLYTQIAEEIGVNVFNLNMRVLSFKETSFCHSYQVSHHSGNNFASLTNLKQPELLLYAFGI
jgi:hypothetical protein